MVSGFFARSQKESGKTLTFRGKDDIIRLREKAPVPGAARGHIWKRWLSSSAYWPGCLESLA